MRQSTKKDIKRVLFIPVSSPTGAGEYYRCLTIAEALIRRKPEWQCHFCLNKKVNVVQLDKFEYHLLKDTPTLDSAGVKRVLENIRPDVVIFDNTLRYAQVKKAADIATVIIFISSRPKKRRTGFALRKLSYIDQHWIIAPPSQQRLSLFENMSLRLGRSPSPKFFATMLPEPIDTRREALLASYSFSRRGYALFISGGGGGTINKRPSAEVFQQAARQYYDMSGQPTILIAGPLSIITLESSNRRLELRAVSPGHLSDLISGAMLVVSGGGSIIHQVLALERPCLAIPAGGKDQLARIRTLNIEKVIITCSPEAKIMADTAMNLASNEGMRFRLSANARQGNFANGLEQALTELVGNDEF